MTLRRRKILLATGTTLAVRVTPCHALRKRSRDPEIARAMESRGAEVGFLGGSVMGASMAADAAKWKRVAAYANITLG